MYAKPGSLFVCVLVILGILCSPSAAQTTAGAISGTVVDQTGAAVPGGRVTALNEATGDTRQVTADSAGEFVFAAVQPGRYTVTAEKEGFQTSRTTGIVVEISQRVALGNVRLNLGQTTESVTVSADVATVNTESADTAPTLTPAQLGNIPVAGRDVMALLRVLPGVSSLDAKPWGEASPNDPAGSASNGGQFGSFTPNVGGARMFWNTVTVDGQVGSNPDFPGLFMAAMSMDAVAEAKLISHNYTADYGRNPGPTISLISKSGTRDFHGTVYAYKRHEMLNANDFFNNRNGLEKPVYRFGTFGLAVGGPIYIPGHFNRDKKKLFFFYSMEDWGTKLPQGISRVTVPTAAERIGDFSQSLDQAGNLRVITDPTTHAPFPGNRIPESRLNPNGQVLLNLMPLPNILDRSLTEGNYNFQWQDVCDIPKRLYALKLDYHPSDRDTIGILPRRWWSDTRAYSCRVLGFGESLPIYQHHYKYSTDSVVINWTHTLSPSMVNEFGTGFTGEKERGPAENLFGRTAENYFDPIKRGTTGFTLGQLYPQANQYDILPASSFNFVPNSPDIGVNDRFPDHQGYERFHIVDNFTLIRSSHTLKFGFNFERNWATDGPHAGCFSGCFDFTQDVNNPLDTGWDFANAVLGNFKQYSESNLRQEYQARNKVFEWFAQDTFKVSRKLTLDYGLRFSWFTPWYVGKGLGAEFVADRYDPTQVPPLFRPVQDPNGPPGAEIAQNPVTGQYGPAVNIGAFTGPFDFTGMVLSTDSSYPRGFREQHGVQVAPRFGFAFDPFGNGKTSIRGGFGIVKEANPTYNSYFWSMVSNPPIQIQPRIYYGNMDTLLQKQGLLFPVSSSSIQREDKVPSIYKYSFGIQRELMRNTTIDVSYVGNVARHLIQGIDINAIPYGARFQPQNIDPVTGTAFPDDFFRPYPGYGGIGQLGNFGWSNYNSLQVAANRRFTRGISFGISYTWGRSMGTGNNDGDTLASYRPWRIWNYGPTIFDQRHVFVFNYVWDLPRLSKLLPNPVVKGVFDNWQLSGVTAFATGLPQSIFLGTEEGADLTGGGDGARTLVVGPVKGPQTFDQWFNTAAFARPPQGDPGNASVFPFYGPGQNNWDITVMKRVPLWSEARSIQFRLEMYNAFNHTQWASVNNSAVFNQAGEQVNGEFGQITGTRAPRVIQLSLRLEF